MKRLISILLCILVIFGTFSFAVSAVREDEYDHLPQIYVAGLGSKNVYYKGDTEKKSVFYPIDTDRILGNLKNIPSYVLSSVASRDKDIIYNCIYNLLYDTFKDGVLEKDGFTPNENTMVDPMKLSYDGDGKYTFNYDCRLDPVDLAHQLHEYIGWVQEDSGSQKVELAGSSYGTAVVVAYLNEYKDYRENIDSVVLCVPSLGGVDLVGELFCGGITVTPIALAQFISVMIGNEDVDLILSILRKSGIFDLLVTCALEPALEAVLVDVLVAFVRDAAGNCPAFWTFVQDEYFYDALSNIYGEDYASDSHECALLIDRITYYHENIMVKSDEIINDSVKDGIKMNVICKYGKPAVPLSEHGNFRSDGVVGLSISSLGATCSMRDEVLPEDYKQAKYPQYNFISVNRCIDASTCVLPFNTWFIEGLEHSQKTKGYYELIDMILYNDPDVFSDENYPQFLQVDKKDKNSLAPLENTPEKEETSLVEDIIKLVKRVIELLVSGVKRLTAK